MKFALTLFLSLLILALRSPSPEDHFIEYFKTNRSDTGLVYDRQSNSNICSIATLGFDMDVQAISATKHLISFDEAKKRINNTLSIVTIRKDGNRGWLYHFIHPNGTPIVGSEVSTIDTAIFYAGALQASLRLHDKILEQKVRDLIGQIDIQWMIKNSPSGKRLCHGLRYTGDFIPCELDEYNEGIIAYHIFNVPFKPTKIRFDLPLFVYYYPLCFIHDDPKLKIYLQLAIAWQKEHYGYVGVTATDTEYGYSSLAIGYVSPVALYCVGEPIPYDLPATLHSYCIKTKWESSDRIGIDEGAAVLMKNRPK